MTTARLAITGAGGAAAIGVMRAIAKEPVDVFAIDADPAAAGLYLVPAARRVIAPLGADPTFGPWLLDWCERNAVDVLMPTVEAEFQPLGLVRERFEEAGIALLMESDETLWHCRDKWALHVAVGSSVPQPETAVLDGDFDVSGWRYPSFVKPRVGSGSRGVARVASPADLWGVPTDGSMIIQDELPGTEYSIDVLCDGPGRVLAAVPRERIKVDSGIAVAARTVDDPELVALAERAAAAIGVSHMANVQLRRGRDGAPRLLEINPRVPGTLALTTAAGINMPRHIIRRALGWPNAAVRRDFAATAMVRMLADVVIAPEELDALTAAQRSAEVPA